MKKIRYSYSDIKRTKNSRPTDRITPKDELSLFKQMLRIRLIEAAIGKNYAKDLMKTPIHLSIGQEAVAVGVCKSLTNNDQLFCGHRTHGPYLAKGGSLKSMLTEMHCRLNGCAGSRGGSMHLIDKEVGMQGSSAIVAGIIPIATGAALALKQQKLNQVVVTFLGDAATEEGVFWESLNFAKLKNLPIIYICENNYYSVCSPLSYRQPEGVEIYAKAKAFGLESFCIDGNNILEVHEAMENAKKNIQNELGPVFIEAHTYRFFGHHGDKEDFHLGYRSLDELNHWKEVDPIEKYKDELISKDLLNKDLLKGMTLEIESEIEEAFHFALQSPFPSEEDLLTHVYAEKG